MRLTGLEPARRETLDPKSNASTNSATGAGISGAKVQNFSETGMDGIFFCGCGGGDGSEIYSEACFSEDVGCGVGNAARKDCKYGPKDFRSGRILPRKGRRAMRMGLSDRCFPPERRFLRAFPFC